MHSPFCSFTIGSKYRGLTVLLRYPCAWGWRLRTGKGLGKTFFTTISPDTYSKAIQENILLSASRDDLFDKKGSQNAFALC